MKFKPNYISKFILVFSMAMASVIPMVAIMFVFLDSSRLIELFDVSILSLPWVFAVICFAFSMVINFIINLFFKKSVVIDEKSMEYQNNRYDLNNVTKLYYDVGNLSGINSIPSRLVITMKNGKEAIVNHPSWRLVLVLRKRCINSTFKTNVVKKFLIYTLLMCITSFIMGLLYGTGVLKPKG